MRHPIHLLLLFAATLLGFASACPPSTSLSGIVRDAESRRALVGASLRIFQQEKLVAQALADTAGRFSLKIQHGTYTIECTHAGYATVRFPKIETIENQDRALEIRLDAAYAGLDEVVVKNYQAPYDGSKGAVGGAGGGPVTYDMAAAPAGMARGTSTSRPAKSATMKAMPATTRGGEDRAPATAPSEPSHYRGEPFVAKSAPKSTAKPAAKPTTAPTPTTAPPMPPPPASVVTDEISTPAPEGGDDIIVVDGVRKRAVIVFEPETYEEKITLVDVDGTPAPAPAADITDKTPEPPIKTEPTKPRAGLLTAGEWNDLHNWNRHWLDLLNDGEIEAHQKTYDFTPRHRYTLLLTNEQDFPLADVAVMLKLGGETLWEARTDNTGKAELWRNLTPGPSPTGEGSLNVVAVVEGKIHNLGSPKEAAAGINRHRIAAECAAPKNVDIVWAVDATGSMGDEIEYLKTELLDVIGRAKSLNGDLSFRMGTTFYRDEGDDYIAKSSGLSYDISKTVDFIRQQHAGGGGDTPEAVHSALEEAIFEQKWSDRAIARICFLVLDASPHQSPEVNASLHRCIREAARRGIRVVPVTASGIQKDTEFLMKFFGLATNGTYVFLTDHSGIGGKHLEPTTDEYKVENLNNLLVRLIGEYTTIETCEGKSAIRFEGDGQQQPGQPWQALYYPNPASTQFMLELPFEVQSVTLYDAEGKAARKLESPQAGLNTVAVNDLSDGFYTIRILKDGRMQSGKILVVKGL